MGCILAVVRAGRNEPQVDGEDAPSWTGNFLIGSMAEAESTGHAGPGVLTHRFSAAHLNLVQTPAIHPGGLHQNPG